MDKIVRSFPCPCGNGKNYSGCCSTYLDEDKFAPSAEALMRSRYSAYVLKREDYVLATWHPSTRPEKLDLAADTQTKWLGLDVKRHELTAPDQAIVEFVARYKINGRAQRLHEISRFIQLDQRWYYVEGTFV